MANKNNLKVERAPFEYNGKSYFDYFICGNIRGTDVKIKVGPPDLKDKGGYTVLDIVFGGETQADFVTEPYEFKNTEARPFRASVTLFARWIRKRAKCMSALLSLFALRTKICFLCLCVEKAV